MTKHLPPIAPPALTFTPVPRKKSRHDGWTADRQRGFIAALAELGSVTAAAARVGMAKEGAYQLRLADGADEFRAAWAAAVDSGVARLADIALERAIDGVPVPIMFQGQQVAERRHYSDRLLTFILRNRQPDQYGAHAPLRPGTRSAWLDALEAEDAHFSPAARQDYLDSRERVRARLTRARRLLLMGIAEDLAKRAAWELLVGPVDWDRAERLEAQDDEPFNDDPDNEEGAPLPSLVEPGMLMAAEAGLLAEMTGGPDALDELREALRQAHAAAAAAATAGEPDANEDTGGEEQTEEERAEAQAYRAQLIADGWTEDEHGNLWSPE